MAYQATINRSNPSCFLFLIDQSSSMEDPWGQGEPGKSKAEGVAIIINRLLSNLIISCTRNEGVRDYFDVGVVGYGDDVVPAFGGALAAQVMHPISRIANAPLRIDQITRKASDDVGGLISTTDDIPVWIDPVANGGTPMCSALHMVHTVLEDWVGTHPTAFPPVIFNITDGEATDGDPLGPAGVLHTLATDDGNVLLFNIHVSSRHGRKISFPASDEDLRDDFSRRLFNMSSTLPPDMQAVARKEDPSIKEGARGFVFQGDAVDVIEFLNMGTIPADVLR